MLREGAIFVGTCGIAGLGRGKGFPARALKSPHGDPMIFPDPTAEMAVDFGDGSAPRVQTRSVDRGRETIAPLSRAQEAGLMSERGVQHANTGRHVFSADPCRGASGRGVG
jgi:hypothetical protein